MAIESDISDEAYQDEILPHVSRTFALTIPQLPAALRVPVTNAYLLCRIADTIEDEPAIKAEQTLIYLRRFAAVVAGSETAAPLALEVAPLFSAATLPAEADLARNMERVIRVLGTFTPPQRAAIGRCVALMCHGMPQFQLNASIRGLATSGDLDDYCYYVAGVVGEMLTELFCEYSPVMARRRAEMAALAVSFAQGLQMTNILKDIWEDRARGACWLPQELFERFGVDLAELSPGTPGFEKGLLELLAVAHGHLRNALTYTLLIPAHEAGIRRFCLWAIGLAVLTLRRIQAHPGFSAGSQVKVSRRAVMATRILTNASVRQDWLLRALFRGAAGHLPMAAGKAPRAASLHLSSLEGDPAQPAASQGAAPSPGAHPSQSVSPSPLGSGSVITDYGRPAMRSHGGSARQWSDGSSMQ